MRTRWLFAAAGLGAASQARPTRAGLGVEPPQERMGVAAAAGPAGRGATAGAASPPRAPAAGPGPEMPSQGARAPRCACGGRGGGRLAATHRRGRSGDSGRCALRGAGRRCLAVHVATRRGREDLRLRRSPCATERDACAVHGPRGPPARTGRMHRPRGAPERTGRTRLGSPGTGAVEEGGSGQRELDYRERSRGARGGGAPRAGESTDSAPCRGVG